MKAEAKQIEEVFLRFVVDEFNADSGRRQGLSHAAFALRDSGKMNPLDYQRLLKITDWFNRNLERPSRFSLSARPNKKNQAISWIKSSATKHVRRMRDMQKIVESYGISVEMIKTRRPGYVFYEDEWQITAYPFADTFQ
jgi:hypothetical protein